MLPVLIVKPFLPESSASTSSLPLLISLTITTMIMLSSLRYRRVRLELPSTFEPFQQKAWTRPTSTCRFYSEQFAFEHWLGYA
jgi:hypothetical protein